MTPSAQIVWRSSEQTSINLPTIGLSAAKHEWKDGFPSGLAPGGRSGGSVAIDGNTLVASALASIELSACATTCRWFNWTKPNHSTAHSMGHCSAQSTREFLVLVLVATSTLALQPVCPLLRSELLLPWRLQQRSAGGWCSAGEPRPIR